MCDCILLFFYSKSIICYFLSNFFAHNFLSLIFTHSHTPLIKWQQKTTKIQAPDIAFAMHRVFSIQTALIDRKNNPQTPKSPKDKPMMLLNCQMATLNDKEIVWQKTACPYESRAVVPLSPLNVTTSFFVDNHPIHVMPESFSPKRLSIVNEEEDIEEFLNSFEENNTKIFFPKNYKGDILLPMTL